jgi:hypothetical protein
MKKNKQNLSASIPDSTDNVSNEIDNLNKDSAKDPSNITFTQNKRERGEGEQHTNQDDIKKPRTEAIEDNNFKSDQTQNQNFLNNTNNINNNQELNNTINSNNLLNSNQPQMPGVVNILNQNIINYPSIRNPNSFNATQNIYQNLAQYGHAGINAQNYPINYYNQFNSKHHINYNL